jgi:hypothetical protein
MSNIRFDDALDSAVDALLAGEHADAVLARFPRHASALAPLLETVRVVRPAPAYEAPSARLAENFARIERALLDARGQVAAREAPREVAPAARAGTPWWRRRVAFASLSLPAGVLALALVSAGGAAAATVATTTGLPDTFAEQVEHVTPSWAHTLIPGGGHGSASPAVDATPTDSAPAVAHTATSPTGGAADGTHLPASPHVGPPEEITASGMVANVRGNTFELVADGVTYKVQIDATTFVAGAIVDDASATVTGDWTGNDRLHATAVHVTEPPHTTPPQSGPATPGLPAEELPPGQIDKTQTPPGLEDRTEPPGPPEAPPAHGENGQGDGNSGANDGNGQGDDNGNADGNGNGEGNGNGNGNGGGNGNGNGGGNGGNP